MVYNFFIPGKPVGKGRPRFTKSGAVYTDSSTKQYENKVRTCFEQKYNYYKRFDVEEPVEIIIHSFYPIPKRLQTKPKQEQIANNELYPITKPDIDNIAKIIMDSLNDVLYKDDKQVVSLKVNKSFPTIAGGEGVLVTIRSVKDEKQRKE